MESLDMPALSVVIPVYLSEEILPELVNQLEEAINSSPAIAKKFEIVMVCDDSPDDSWTTITQLASTRPHLKGLLLRTNAGQHNALMAGLRVASGDTVVTMDDDLQHSPKDIPSLLELLDQGNDVVFAKFKARRHSWWKVLGSKFNDFFAIYLLGKPKDVYLSPFRAFHSELSKDIQRYRGPYVYIDGLILASTTRIGSIEVAHHERYKGASGYNLRKSISLWLKMATGFSIAPLRLTSLAGLIISMLGFLLAIALIVQKLTIDTMPDGWASIIVTILIIGGMQLLALGVIGEYLGRLLLTVNAKPQFVVAETIHLTDVDVLP